MKTKCYEFTIIELMAIRDSLDDHWHNTLKNLKPISPIAIKEKNTVRILLDQLKNDIFKY